MMYRSLNDSRIRRTFSEALREGLAPDRGLYVPVELPAIAWEGLKGCTLSELATNFLSPLVGDAISPSDLHTLMSDALDFPIPLHHVEDSLHLLELYHGPTAAFKDVGGRIMSRLLGATTHERLTVLVATSGDTGSAVAQGFFEVPGIDVVILYPSGRISQIQEQQLTTVGSNVVALEVLGSFDDCQSMVKEAFLDQTLQSARALTSANSINIGRWMPQAIYYAWATAQAEEALNFVVPSGNFGNIAAGVLAMRMGMPARSFVAAVNANDGMARYVQSGIFTPRKSISTLSNAMDVGDPSNRPRLEWLYASQGRQLEHELRARAVSDDETLGEMLHYWKAHGTLICPHTAVGTHVASSIELDGPTAVLATADAAKFGDVVERATGQTPGIPASLSGCLKREKSSIILPANYPALRSFLLDTDTA